ncbi:response regulator [Sphingobium mellinum]|uniref:response regulator n=1 Tax=Sphingobium mellinum TaxID=1387166 RepID=UPI0030ECFF65
MNAELLGKTILVVEDEFFIAKEIKQVLVEAGAVIIGPVGDVGSGLAVARTATLDFAVLDVNLNGEACFAIADSLTDRGVPYLFLTGYDGWALPDAYREVRCIPKPFGAEQLVAAIQQSSQSGGKA